MKIELNGRTAIVTGSTAGIGRATAEGTTRAGVSVIINGRTEARVDEAVRQMRAISAKSYLRHCRGSVDGGGRQRLCREGARSGL